MTYGEYRRNPHQLGYDMSLFIGQSQPKPSVILLKDSLVLAEVFGAGFTKAPGGKVCLLSVHPSLADREMFRSNQYYELRFPRMTKAYRRRDRTWRECISLEDFQRIARETVGRERPGKEADDWCKNLFGKVASPGVKHPLRREQREEAILADLERVEGGHRDGGHKIKDRNSKKRKRTADSSQHLGDRRPHHRESTYLENVDRGVEGSPRAVIAQQRGPASLVPSVTPRPSRRLAPLASMTNVALTDPTTPPKSPLDDPGFDRLGHGESGKGGGLTDSKECSGNNWDPFVDEGGCQTGDRVGLEINHPFSIPSPPPPLSPPTTTPRRKRMGLQTNADTQIVPGDSPPKVDTVTGQTTPFVSQSKPTPSSPKTGLDYMAGKSLPTPVSNGPIKYVPPPMSSPTTKDAFSGEKRKRGEEENVRPPPQKVIRMGSSPPVQKVPGPSSCNSKPSETWSPDETTFMEEPRLAHDPPRSKTRRGDMSVDAIKARLIRATSTLQILPPRKPDVTVRDPTVVIEERNIESTRTNPVAYEKTLEDDAEPGRRKACSSASIFGIPTPFPPGTSGPGSSLDRPNNSDKIAMYHGADKFYLSRPSSSAILQRSPKFSESVNGDGKSLAPIPDDGDTKKDDIFIGRFSQPKLEDSKKAVARFSSFVLEPQQLLFIDTAVGKLMSTSVVWFARDVHVTEPSHRPSSLQLVPRLNEVSQLESLLVACGWHRKKGFTSKRGIERGVVFVDYEEQADIQPVIKTHWVAQQCESAYQLATRYQAPIERGMRPIWIMDARVLGWERLRSMKPGEALDTLEEYVLWKKE